MINKSKNQKTLWVKLFFVVFVCVLAFPSSVFSADAKPAIIISTEKDEFNIGDEIGVKFQLMTEGVSITSIDLLFTYDPELLEYVDSDLAQAGVQISTVSSSFTTIIKNIVSPDVGEIKFAGSRIGGITGEAMLFNSVFKVLKAGDAIISTDMMMTKVLDASGAVGFEPGLKSISLVDPDAIDADTTGGEDNELDIVAESTDLLISHNPPLSIVPNQDLQMQIVVSPDSGVKEARMYFKNSIDTSFAPVKLSSIGDDKFQGDIPKTKVIIGDIQYFFGIIDVNDTPHRYPIEDDKFLDLVVRLNSTPAAISDINNSLPQTTNSNQSNTTSYTYTSKTGPDSVYLFGVSVFMMLMITLYTSNNRRKNSC